MSNDVGDGIRPTQDTVAVTQEKLSLFLGMTLFLLDYEQRRFMRVPEDREQGGAVHVIQRVVTPFPGRDTRAVGGQYLTEFGSGKIKLTAKLFRNGYARHVRLSPAFLLAVMRLPGMLGHLGVACQQQLPCNGVAMRWFVRFAGCMQYPTEAVPTGPRR